VVSEIVEEEKTVAAAAEVAVAPGSKDIERAPDDLVILYSSQHP
jgi:hypothetical protein